MEIRDFISLISLFVAICAILYTIISNIERSKTKKYELTYQYFNDMLLWHKEVIGVLTLLNLPSEDLETNEHKRLLTNLSALIEVGRFYFPNVCKDDGFGEKKPTAYRGYRDIVLDLLVFSYKIYERNDYYKYGNHTEALRRSFTSRVFEHLDPVKFKGYVHKNTGITSTTNFTIDDYLTKDPEFIYTIYPDSK